MACHPWHAHIYIYFIFPSNIHDGIGSQTSVQRRAQRMPSASKHAHPPWLNEATCCSTYIQACNIPSRRAQKGSCKDMHVRIHVRTPPGVHPSTYPPDTHTTHKHVPVSHRILPTIGDFFLRFYCGFCLSTSIIIILTFSGGAQCGWTSSVQAPSSTIPLISSISFHTHPICKYGLCDHIHFAQSHCVNHIQNHVIQTSCASAKCK